MNPIMLSVLTSIGLGVASSVAGWAASKGVIAQGDQANFTNTLMGLGATAAAAGIGWFKAQKWTQASVISVVNSPAVPGVKVVAETASAPKVSQPIPPATLEK